MWVMGGSGWVGVRAVGGRAVAWNTGPPAGASSQHPGGLIARGR